MERELIEVRDFSFHTPYETFYERRNRYLSPHTVTNLSILTARRFHDVSVEVSKRNGKSIIKKQTSRTTNPMLFQTFSIMYEPTSQTENQSNQSDLTSSRGPTTKMAIEEET